jgi:hypothetical protein
MIRRTSEPSGAIANKSMIPPKLVLTCRPIRIQPEEIISGRAVILSSRSFSVASFETVSASGVAPTFQMACWIGMENP